MSTYPRGWDRRRALLALAAAPLLVPGRARAGGEIKVGASLSLTGPSKSLGVEMARGIGVCFAEANEAAGPRGDVLRLVALDDGYIPEIAGDNMNRLLDAEKVLAVLGNVGTPTAEVTVPIANARKTLLLGAFSGAGLLRKTPPDRYVINYRASYAEETAAMVAGLFRAGVRPFEIAFFSQNDGYGDAGYQGAVEALEAGGYKEARRLAHGRYKRGSLDVEEALLTLLDAEIKPRAVIMICTSAPGAKLIKLARSALPRTLFLNVSFVGGAALLDALGKAGQGVVVTQVVPIDAELPGCREYLRVLRKYAPGAAPDFVSLEGYLVARIFVEGLRRAGAGATREGLITAIESLRDLDLGLGAPLSFGPAQHQGSRTVWPTVIRDGRFAPFRWEDLAR